MGPNTCPACEHVCCILGPLSLNVTLGGHPWVPDSGLTRLISTPPPIHTPLEELALSRPLPPGSPLPAAASRGECRALPRQAVQTRAPASLCAGAGGEPRLGPRSSARPETARPSPRLLALGGPPDCPSGLRLWPAGPGKLLHGPQHRKSTHHLIRPGAGAQRAGVLPAAPPHPSPARAPGVTQLAPPPPPPPPLANKGPGHSRRLAAGAPGRRLRARWIPPEARTVEMGPEMRLTRICCCCCLLYQLGFLSHGTISGTFWSDFPVSSPTWPVRTEDTQEGRTGAPVRVELTSVDSRELACGVDEQVRVAREAHFSWSHFSICKMISSPIPTPSNSSKLCLPYLEENREACHVLLLRLCWSSHRFQLVHAKISSPHFYFERCPSL